MKTGGREKRFAGYKEKIWNKRIKMVGGGEEGVGGFERRRSYAIVLYMFTFVTKSVVEMFQVQGWISELNFEYTAKMGGYANMSSDIPKLCARTKRGIMHHEDSSIVAG